MPFINLLCRQQKLNTISYKYSYLDRNIVLVGRSLSMLRKAAQADEAHDFQGMGFYLGYPYCCTQQYYKEHIRQEEHCFPLLSLAQTKSSARLNFLLNYLYNFDSRQYYKTQELHRAGYRFWHAFVIPHIPCSFECPQSLLYAEELWKILGRFFPNYQSKLKKYLQRPIFFLGDCEFVPLEGRAQRKAVWYSSPVNAKNLLEKSLLQLIVRGNRIRIENDTSSVWKGRRRIGTIDRRGAIFNFSGFSKGA
ncbi:MAG: hypothetical protein V1828_03150 [Candidatus Omnitrophota bacterium]